MEEPLAIDLHELRTAFARVLDACEERLGRRVVLGHLPVDAAFDMSKEPGEFTVGQLSEDLSAVTSATRPEALTAWHELAHMIRLLRAVEARARS